MYLSEECEENRNRILKECAYTKKKHEEIEKRYKRLVEPAPQFNFAVKRKAVGVEPKNGLGHKGMRQCKEISENLQKEFNREFCEEDETVRADLSEVEPMPDVEADAETEIEIETKTEIAAESETGVEPEAEGELKAGAETGPVDGGEAEEAHARTVQGGFESFYEKNLAEVLEKPEFEEIRKFIGEERDFSKAAYRDLMKAFGMDAEVGAEVIAEGSDSEAEPAREAADGWPESGAESEGDLADEEKIITEVEAEIVGVSDKEDEIHGGLGKVFAVPLQREVEKKTFSLEPVKFRIIKAALAAAVMVVGALVVYSIW